MPSDVPERRVRRVSREQFEALLIEVRDGATAGVIERSVDGSDAVLKDARDVWHAAEAALGVLMMETYAPKREALEDMRRVVAWYDDMA